MSRDDALALSAIAAEAIRGGHPVRRLDISERAYGPDVNMWDRWRLAAQSIRRRQAILAREKARRKCA